MNNIPAKIYLQIGLEDYGDSCSDFKELNEGDITWSSEKINTDDIEYLLPNSINVNDEIARLEDIIEIQYQQIKSLKEINNVLMGLKKPIVNHITPQSLDDLKPIQ